MAFVHLAYGNGFGLISDGKPTKMLQRLRGGEHGQRIIFFMHWYTNTPDRVTMIQINDIISGLENDFVLAFAGV